MEREEKKDKREAKFTNDDSGNVIKKDLLGHHRYSGYRERMLEKYPFHQKEIMAAIMMPSSIQEKEQQLLSKLLEVEDSLGNYLRSQR